MSNIFTDLSRNAVRCCLALAILFCAVPCAESPAAVYEVSATGKDAAAAEGNARLNALRQCLNTLIAPEESKKHAMDLRPVLRKTGSLTRVKVLKTKTKGARTEITARVTVDDEALSTELKAIPALRAIIDQPSTADSGEKPAAAENPQQPKVTSEDSSSPGQGSGFAEAPGKDKAFSGVQTPQSAAMPDAAFLKLVANSKTPPEAIISALKAGANPNAAVTADDRPLYTNPDWPALMVYLYEKTGPRDKSAAVVKAFLDAGADADWHSTVGLQRQITQTAMYLSFRGDEDEQIFRLILSARPDLNRVFYSGHGLLHDYLDHNGKPEIFAYMLECGADPNTVKKDNRQTPVLFDSIRSPAGKLHPTDFLQAMLKAGANPNITDGTGQPVLHFALECEAWEHAMLLLDAGAAPNTTNKNGETALLYAVKDGAPADLIEAMLTHKADPNRVDKMGCPPLGFAIQKNRPDIVRLLIRKGARLDFAIPYENETFSPMEFAEKLGREEMISDMRELAQTGGGESSLSKKQEDRAQKAGAMPDAEFLKLVADGKTTPAAILNALAAGANPNAVVTNEMHIPAPLNIISWPPLMLYLHPNTGPKNKSAQVVKAFIKAGANASWINEGGYHRESIVKTAMRLSFNGDAEGEAIFRSIVSAKPDMNRVDQYGYTLLHDWLDSLNHNQKTDILEYMLAHGADPNAIRQSDNPRRRQPVLFDAIKGITGDPLPINNLAAMLKYGANPDICDGVGNSALHYALESKAYDAFDLLLRSGADPNKVNDKGETPLFCAVDDQADMAYIKALLNHKADVNIAAAKRNNNTPLIEAARSWEKDSGEELVDLLLAAGADPNARVANGRTALLFAVRDKKAEIVRKLLEKGADPNIPEQDGISPLVYAVRGGSVDMVRLLVKHGADTKAKIKYKDGRMVSLKELVELQAEVWKISDEMKACIAGLPD